MNLVRNAECGVRSGSADHRAKRVHNSALRIPHSALATEHRRLFRAPWGRKAEMLVRARRGAAAARGAGQESLLHQERLVQFLEGPRVPPYRAGAGGEAPPGPPQLDLDLLVGWPAAVFSPQLVPLPSLLR